MKKFYYSLFLLTATCFAQAQSTPDWQPDMSRALFHYKVDKAQKDMLARDGRADNELKVSEDEELNLQLTYQATQRIDNLQKEIEQSKTLTHNAKLTYLRGLADLINAFSKEVSTQQLKWAQLPMLINGFEDAMQLNDQSQSVQGALRPLNYQLSKILVSNFAFNANPRIEETKGILFLKYLDENPEKLLKELSKQPNFSFTDSLLVVAARRRPEELISYAQARRTPLGLKIAACQDPLVKQIAALSMDNSGQLYLPFLDKLSSGQLQKSTIQEALSDSSKYYKLLVQTEVDYAARVAHGDTPVVRQGLQAMLKQKSMEVYVNTINGLHDLPDAVRFKKIQALTPEELYYLIVLNELEIYTSSYIYVYKRIFETMPVKSSDSLLQRVSYDKYKKFITMASNYNTLDDFLSKMSKESATKLMTNFVDNLEKTRDKNDIEDAVDVANAYATIKDPAIKKLMLDEVSKNLEDAITSGNEKARTIYNLEKVIMESSSDSSKEANMSATLGIPPVFEVKNKYLQDAKGRIILQMFFLDDGAGKGSFSTLMTLYSDRKKWRMTSTPDWVQFTSIGTPVPFYVFANRPLDGVNDLDEEAQKKLTRYLLDSGYQPSIIVHRGHSFSLNSTIEKMQPTSKVVVLGSCGAYHNLAEILKISPDAYIIGSKQTGFGAVNVPLFSYLVENLKMGKDVLWETMKNEVGNSIIGVKKEDYEDYIFPHRNLGAIFIKAYRKALEGEGSQLSGL